MTKLTVGQTVTLQTTDEYNGKTAIVNKFFSTSTDISVIADGDDEPISVKEYEIVGTDANKHAHLAVTNMTELMQLRNELSLEWKYANEGLYETRKRKIDAAMMGDAYHYDEDALNNAIEAASIALNIFDEAHPEVIKQIMCDKEEATIRNRWM